MNRLGTTAKVALLVAAVLFVWVLLVMNVRGPA